jgi:CO/xanthine dehydrogenase FAD-binding subunit
MASEAYRRPETLTEALALLAEGGPARPLVLAGGTDIYPAQAAAEAWMRPEPPRPVLDITALPGLSAIEDRGDHHRIGALVTWAALRDPAKALPPAFDGLRAAAAQVGGVQVQNRGTVVGNLCNASPAADGVPPLLTLEAELELASAGSGVRRLPLADFLLGNRRTALMPDELALALVVPKRTAGARAGFLKLGARRYLVISIVMAAGVIEAEGGRVASARLALGACSPVAQRLPAAEAALRGLPIDPTTVAAAVRPDHLAQLSPIGDVRASAAYRQEAALVLLRRLVSQLAAPGALERAA